MLGCPGRVTVYFSSQPFPEGRTESGQVGYSAKPPTLPLQFLPPNPRSENGTVFPLGPEENIIREILFDHSTLTWPPSWHLHRPCALRTCWGAYDLGGAPCLKAPAWWGPAEWDASPVSRASQEKALVTISTWLENDFKSTPQLSLPSHPGLNCLKETKILGLWVTHF